MLATAASKLGLTGLGIQAISAVGNSIRQFSSTENTDLKQALRELIPAQQVRVAPAFLATHKPGAHHA